MTTRGTKEWAEKNFNFSSGCPYNCRYCYAKGMAIRFGRKTADTWRHPEINCPILTKRFAKTRGTIMFPSSHDIPPSFLRYYLPLLIRMLDAGNKVLIVTKPSSPVIQRICETATPWRSQVKFRFTITTLDPKISRYWEPGAPKPTQRLDALALAHQHGFSTSVSIEPFLSDPVPTIAAVQDHVTDTIWVGPMNKRFCPSTDWKPDLWNPEAISSLKTRIDALRNPHIRYKDAFLNTLSLAKPILLQSQSL